MNDLRPLCSIVYILAQPWLDTKLNRSVIGSHLHGASSFSNGERRLTSLHPARMAVQ